MENKLPLGVVIELEIPATNPGRLEYWCSRLNIYVRKRGKATWIIQTNNAIDIFWLGCNLTMAPFETGVTKHH